MVRVVFPEHSFVSPASSHSLVSTLVGGGGGGVQEYNT